MKDKLKENFLIGFTGALAGGITLSFFPDNILLMAILTGIGSSIGVLIFYTTQLSIPKFFFQKIKIAILLFLASIISFIVAFYFKEDLTQVNINFFSFIGLPNPNSPEFGKYYYRVPLASVLIYQLTFAPILYLSVVIAEIQRLENVIESLLSGIGVFLFFPFATLLAYCIHLCIVYLFYLFCDQDASCLQSYESTFFNIGTLIFFIFYHGFLRILILEQKD